MSWNPITRRNFLRGPGKAALMLPILPSLMSKKAQAQAAGVKQKNFIGITMHNGLADAYSVGEGAKSDYMPVYKNMQTLAGKHAIHYKPLADTLADNGGMISKVFDAGWNPYVPKMLMMQGLDFLPIPYKHHSAHFGNTANTQAGGDDGLPPPPAMATIDQVMAYSTNFYKNPALVGKSVTWALGGNESNWYDSHTFGNPADKIKGPITPVNSVSDPSVIWDKFFKGFVKPPAQPAGPTYEQTLVDLVLADYKNFSSSPRLAKQDKQRLDQHMALLHTTETSVKSVVAAASCNNPPARPASSSPASQADRTALAGAMNNLIVSLISCGLCHSFLGHFYSLVSNDPNMWHTWSHGNDVNPVVNEFNQTHGVAKDVVLDLVKKLDSNGLLDDSLVVVPQEHSKRKHEAWNIPVVMIGSAGGVLKTGQYVDFRDMSQRDDLEFTRYGYPMTQALANMLIAMDVPPSEFEPLNRDTRGTLFSSATSGYGSNFISTAFGGAASYKAQFKGYNLSDWLPLIRA